MHIVHVHIHVDTEHLEAFEKATLENARNSLHEPGVLRFDVIRQADDPTRFVLVEVYRSPQDQADHRETTHYKAWREAVEPMLSEPRSGVKYINVFPADEDW